MTTTMTRRGFLARRLAPAALAATGLQAMPALAAPKVPVQVWKDPGCGCCKDWVKHLEAHGFTVQVFDTGNAEARARLKMPIEMGSCHTAWVGGYAIEGHVPAPAIHQLLKDKPKAIGLSVPGMPVGSPGMDGPEYGGRKDPYDVLLVMADGKTRVWQSHR